MGTIKLRHKSNCNEFFRNDLRLLQHSRIDFAWIKRSRFQKRRGFL